MTIRLRPAAHADIDALHRLRLAVRENRLVNPDRVTADSYRPYVDAGSIWLAEDAGELLGFAALDRASASVWALFVAPEVEGQGVGRALHDRLIDHARVHALGELTLDTAPATRAASFYTRAGWEAVGPGTDGQLRFRKVIAPRGPTPGN